MFIGRFVKGEKVWVTVATHKFENGQEFASTVTGYYILVGALFTTKVALTFNVMDSLTGVYYAEIDTTGFAEGTYMAVIECDINAVLANTISFFEVRNVYGRYGP